MLFTEGKDSRCTDLQDTVQNNRSRLKVLSITIHNLNGSLTTGANNNRGGL